MLFGVENLTVAVDERAAEGGRHAALEREGEERSLFEEARLFQRVRRRQVGGLARLHGGVVVGHGLFEHLGVHAHVGREFGDGVARVDRGLRLLVAVDAGLDGRNVDDLLVNHDEGPVVGRDRRELLRDGDVGHDFIENSGAFLVDDDAVVDHRRGVGLRGTVDRTAVELIEVRVVGQEGAGELDVFAHHVGRAAQGHPGDAASHVLADHFAVGMEAARRDDDAGSGLEFEQTVRLRDGLHARAGEKRRLREFDHLGVGEEGDVLVLLDFVKHLGRELRAARLLRAGHDVTAHGGGPDFANHLAPLDAAAIGEPLDAVGALFAVDARELGVATALRDGHHVLVELFDRVGEAVFLLHEGVRGVEVTARVDGVAKGHRHLFEERHLGAEVGGFNGGGHAGAARADDDEVVRGSAGLVLLDFGVRHAGAGGDGREEPGLEGVAAVDTLHGFLLCGGTIPS